MEIDDFQPTVVFVFIRSVKESPEMFYLSLQRQYYNFQVKNKTIYKFSK